MVLTETITSCDMKKRDETRIRQYERGMSYLFLAKSDTKPIVVKPIEDVLE